jgi:hypothetical protein
VGVFFNVPFGSLFPLMERRIRKRTTPGPLLGQMRGIGLHPHVPWVRTRLFEKSVEPTFLGCPQEALILTPLHNAVP